MDSPNPVTSFNSASNSDEAMDSQLRWGPWRLKGFWGTANNVVACSYLLLLIFFSFWPNYLDVSNPVSMNWAILVTGFIMIFSIGYYLIWARKIYTGPIVDNNLYGM
jgi:choline transport protein